MKTFHIAVIAGDGIGKEVVPEGIRVVDASTLVAANWRTPYGHGLEPSPPLS